MRTWLITLCLASLATAANAVEKTEGVWQVLDGCRLVSAPFNDGDSFLVKHGEESFTFRLYYVDALETSTAHPDRVRGQARYFALPESAVTDGGRLAAQFTKKFLRDEFSVITKWEDARGDSGQKRYFALVRKNNQFLSTELMLAGLARLYGKPTEDRWPGGLAPRSFLSRLKNNERQAQREQRGIWALASGSLQMSGLEVLSTGAEASGSPELASGNQPVPLKERINVNTASSGKLQELPGIGPALAARIISARPIASVESLVEIPGISANTLAGFSQRVITEDPPPPPFTVAFYKADLDRFLETEVTVRVAAVAQSDAESPDSFRAVKLQTAHGGEDGGQITAFIPDEFYESFLHHYREPDREFTALLYERESEVVLVHVRK